MCQFVFRHKMHFLCLVIDRRIRAQSQTEFPPVGPKNVFSTMGPLKMRATFSIHILSMYFLRMFFEMLSLSFSVLYIVRISNSFLTDV